MRRLPFIASLASTAAVSAGVPRAASAQALTPITIATLINDTATAALYASKADLFRKAGLDATLQVVSSGAAGASAVAGGAAQFGLSSLVNIITAHEKGVPFTLIAPAGVATSDVAYSQFVVRSDSPIKTGRDMNGKTIGVPGLKDLDAVAISNWVDQNGGDSKTLKFVEMPATVALAAIQDSRIDGADLNTPTLTRALESGKMRSLAQIFDAIAPRFENTGWFTTTDYAAKNPTVAARFAKVITDANIYCNGHHAETVQLVADNAKIDAAIVSRMARITFGDYLRPSEIQPLINVSAKYGVIAKPYDASALISPHALKPPAR